MTLSPAPAPSPASRPLPLATALRRAFAKGYGLADLRADLLAGSVVGVVALPLSMALAIAVGAPPQHGLYTAVIAGAITAILGGCKFQVTGPTAAFIVILAPSRPSGWSMTRAFGDRRERVRRWAGCL